MRLNDLRLSSSVSSFLDYCNRRLRGVETGIKRLDDLLLGLRGVTVIQGAPGSNKSTFALQVAVHQAQRGNPVFVVDRENGINRYRMRMVCCLFGVSETEVMTASLDQKKAWLATVAELPIFLTTLPLKPEQLAELVGEMGNAFSQDDMIMIVDSLQKMPTLGADQRISFEQWMGHLDQLKLEHEGRLTILAVSEKSRGQGGANYEVASLSAAKGSGAVEYTGELVLDLRANKATGGLILEVAKNRDGIANVSVDLAKRLSDESNPSSFTFKLEEYA